MSSHYSKQSFTFPYTEQSESGPQFLVENASTVTKSTHAEDSYKQSPKQDTGQRANSALTPASTFTYASRNTRKESSNILQPNITNHRNQYLYNKNNSDAGAVNSYSLTNTV